MAAVDLNIAAVEEADLCAELLQDLEQGRHVGDLGDILDAADTVYQKGGRDNGDGGVLCAADAHLTKERLAALYDIFRHKKLLMEREQ